MSNNKKTISDLLIHKIDRKIQIRERLHMNEYFTLNSVENYYQINLERSEYLKFKNEIKAMEKEQHLNLIQWIIQNKELRNCSGISKETAEHYLEEFYEQQ